MKLAIPFEVPDHAFRREYKTADEEMLRFNSPESAERYLKKFSLVDKILCNLLVHPQTKRYHAAKIAEKMSPLKMRWNRNIYFYYNLFEDNNSSYTLIEKGPQLYTVPKHDQPAMSLN